MSLRPNPVAMTSAMLMQRAILLPMRDSVTPSHHSAACLVASLASRLHRLAPACKRQAVAECNGEWFDGQRDHWTRMPDYQWALSLQDLDASITKGRERIKRSIAKLNADLAPLAIIASANGDPRGIVLNLRSTAPNLPLPSNGFNADTWGIA